MRSPFVGVVDNYDILFGYIGALLYHPGCRELHNTNEERQPNFALGYDRSRL